MTARHAGYLVILADDIREDDESVLIALRMVKGVKAVTPVEASHDQLIARYRRDDLWRDRLRELIRTGPGGES